MFKKENLLLLQNKLKEDGLKAYYIANSDPHSSEYLASHFFAERLFFAPFTGDTGSLLVTQDGAYLFTDGRFFIQAERELKDSGVTLMKMGEKNVPTLTEFIKNNNLYPLGTSLFVLPTSLYARISKGGEVKDVDYSYLVEDRPLLSKEKIVKFDDSLFSLTSKEKIEMICEVLDEKEIEANLINSLDDIAYILNCRGKDIACNPVFYSFLYISKKYGNHLFIDLDKVDFELEGIKLHSYEEIIPFVEEHKDVITLIDNSKMNAKIDNILNNKVYGRNPSYLMKAIKGDVEVENTKKIQAYDGLALVKFIDFLNKHLDDNLTEYEYSEALKGFRFENKACFDLSFETIAAVGPNAAQMHYSPTSTCSSIVSKKDEVLLVDSGGQYYGGTTDTTRTFPLSENLSKEFIHDYTLTLKAVIALSTSIFLYGSDGHTLDIKARELFWKEGKDYKCGTGHGVGYILNVHEGPNGFRYRSVPERDDQARLEEGMITTVEPGVYIEGKYGIRIENNLLAKKAFETSEGVFYSFETITYVPISTRCLDLDMMSDEEIEWLNSYHSLVKEKLSPLTSDKHLLEVIDELTKPVSR